MAGRSQIQAFWQGPGPTPPFLALAGLALSMLCGTASAEPPHSDEIQAYATIAAMAQTASDRCADILVNQDLLGQAPGHFHMTPDDRQAYLFAVQLEMKRLAATIDAASSLKAWCDEAYRTYGPAGDKQGLLGK